VTAERWLRLKEVFERDMAKRDAGERGPSSRSSCQGDPAPLEGRPVGFWVRGETSARVWPNRRWPWREWRNAITGAAQALGTSVSSRRPWPHLAANRPPAVTKAESRTFRGYRTDLRAMLSARKQARKLGRGAPTKPAKPLVQQIRTLRWSSD